MKRVLLRLHSLLMAKCLHFYHLPAYPSREFGNQDGQLHDHVFPAANTALQPLNIKFASPLVDTAGPFLSGAGTQYQPWEPW